VEIRIGDQVVGFGGSLREALTSRAETAIRRVVL
jgi:hypothetical protein